VTVRPTATERIARTRDLLSRIVAPAVEDPHAAEILRWCIAGLDGIVNQGVAADKRLDDEVSDIEALLSSIGLPQDVGQAGAGNVGVVRDVERRALDARAALAAAIRDHCFRPGSEDLDRRFGAYFVRALSR